MQITVPVGSACTRMCLFTTERKRVKRERQLSASPPPRRAACMQAASDYQR